MLQVVEVADVVGWGGGGEAELFVVCKGQRLKLT